MKKSLFLLALIAVLFSCSKNENEPTPSPSDLSGSILGRWRLVKIVVKDARSSRDYVDTVNHNFCTVTPPNDSTKYTVTINNINDPNLFCEFTNIDAGGDATGYKIGTQVDIVMMMVSATVFNANTSVTSYTFDASEVYIGPFIGVSIYNPTCQIRCHLDAMFGGLLTYYRVASDNSYIDCMGAVTKIKKLTSSELVVYPLSDYNVELYFTKISN